MPPLRLVITRHVEGKVLRNPLTRAVAGLLLAASCGAHAQSTDGHHSIQVVPVVVDSASFAQRFTLSTPNAYPVGVSARFLPGTGTAQAAAGAVSCNSLVIPAAGSTSVASLRTLCPGLVAGAAFGFLVLKAADSTDGMYSDIPVFAAYSRVSNPQGNGFSVEAFPAHTFTSATTAVTGARRLAATANAPAFQTNCFIAQMNRLAGPPTMAATRVHYRVEHGSGEWASFVDVLPGQLVRLLDVFATAGAPAGDYEDARVVFDPDNAAGWPAILSFCTVQDNTSFGADFRVAKTTQGTLGMASQDGLAAREIVRKSDAQGRAFEIGTGASANTHVVYFRHPDTVQCRLLHPVSLAPLTAASGLEMRLYDTALMDAGGDLKTATGTIYLGDKQERGGRNERYLIEVESNESNTGVTRPYAIYCASGSGNTFGYDIVRYQESVDRF
jgi:hypothetical protein